jgi:C1A family cysteine protease
MTYLQRIVAFFLLFCASCQVAAQSYQERPSWVTRYLDGGGDIRNITGLVRPANWRQGARFNNMSAELRGSLPAHFDWNDWYKLQPIKNQASCGSCWAFAITATVESLYWIKNSQSDNRWYDLAEQTLVSSCESGGSCAGGYFTAFNYVRNSGLPHESQDPYTARNSSCKDGLKNVQKAIYWSYVGEDDGRPTTEQIKAAIFHYGPVTVDVNGGFGSYGSGVYTGCGSTGTNHMVVLDGWTDDSTYAQNGGGYWHMRNSWGTGWGEDGYMKIVYKSSRGSNCNGIGNTTAYAVIEGLEPQKALKAKFTE